MSEFYTDMMFGTFIGSFFGILLSCIRHRRFPDTDDCWLMALATILWPIWILCCVIIIFKMVKSK